MTASFQINPSLHLVSIPVPTNQKAVQTPKSTNLIFVLDCSGSMSGSDAKVREQCKKKITTSLKAGDSVTLLWFSGRGEFGVILEGETVDTLQDLQRVHGVIDRWIHATGLTGFKEPLVEAGNAARRLRTKFPDNTNVMMFMTDGGENQWPRPDVVKTVEAIAGDFDAISFVEYGNYADRAFLSQLAERAGGAHVVASDFDKFDVAVTDFMNKRVLGGKKVEVPLPNVDIIGGFLFALDGQDLISFAPQAIQGMKVLVPESTREVFFLCPTKVGAAGPSIDEQASSGGTREALQGAYAALSLFSLRMRPDVVFPLLSALGDVRFIESFANCFGKQAYTRFMQEAQAAAVNESLRFQQGRNPSLVPREDAFTVLELLGRLQEDEGSVVLLNDPRFVYNRISRARVDSNSVLTTEEQAQVAALQKQMSGEKDPKKVKAITDQIAAITAKPEPLKFVEDPTLATRGYEIRDLTWNQERPNVSVLVTKIGTVDLSSRADRPAKVPAIFPTRTFRNYSIVTDGIVNVDKLPTRISPTLADLLREEMKAGRLAKDAVAFDGDVTLFLLDKIPVLNRRQVKTVSAEALFRQEYALQKVKGEQKVLNNVKASVVPEGTRGLGIAETYGADAAAWLEAQGITDKGFAPLMVQKESTDFYVAKALEVSIAGLSNLPSVSKVQEKMKVVAADPKKKFTISENTMVGAIKATSEYLASNVVKGQEASEAVKKWATEQAEKKTAECRALMREIAQTKFAVIVGQTWFSEFKSLEENSLKLKLDDFEVACKVNLTEPEIKL